MSTSTTFHSGEGAETTSTPQYMYRVTLPFHGTHDVLKINSFLSTMRIQFEFHDIPEKKRIHFVANHFESLASLWFHSWREDNKDASYETFVKAFKKRFERIPDPEQLFNDMERLQPMEMGSDAFITEFNRLYRLLPPGSLSLVAAKHFYLKNMDRSIAIAIRLANPQTFEELYNITYDYIPYKERTSYTPTRNENAKSTDDILATTAPIYRRNYNRNGCTDRNRGKVGKNNYSLRKERRTKGLCYRCGKADHRYRDCPESRTFYNRVSKNLNLAGPTLSP
ncbi:AGL178W family transposase [Vanderwaltozyma polyspora DSM 70294]|uniref:AGL178W family transposase n=1 Tax=Vanderwaltozyma polyspora (strain ATCC 22028 / DSM 70294 / BCRC 21397 / CBS 2163 / NBRC 10782 / NRRL Y-8283 / UCD 57-17) TaxID=436907 RepID=A7TLQ6_VANPO|nr:AGL178W family transposase [Vanderwaltozyma polyspora DSM 70294]EDO16848.1 AGL178W family transposase [Vanderwaltozyma polyspora DSM 70294]